MSGLRHANVIPDYKRHDVEFDIYVPFLKQANVAL